jgi:RHH-type proline utilization regulon transcriptional repressor/proline dehydrogenase/delta 1-pyrroline-5-carboxylate dehydrogenase
MSSLQPAELDRKILEMGQDVFTRMQGETPGVFNKDYWQGRILEWAMKDPTFKVDMFRFVDVLPMLDDKEQVSRHIKEYLLKEGRELPGVMKAALKAASGGIGAGLGAAAIKKNVTEMASRFIVGNDSKSAIGVLKKLHKQGIAFTVDLLGEATVSEEEADAYAARYLELIDGLADEAAKWSGDDIIDRNHLGPIPRVNVSLKISAMYSQIDPIDPAGSVAALKKRVLPLFLRAKERGVFLNVDLEQWSVHDITYDLFEELLGEPELRDYPHLGIVVQAYLKSGDRDVERLMSMARTRGAPLTVRLVKGAYWDYETVLAQQHGWEIPVYQDKAETDQAYERLSRKMLENIDLLMPAFGSHNLRSVTNALVLAKELKVPEKAYEVQMLYGMAEPERKVFRGLGHRVRVYAPVGEMLPGMAYLVRRLLENTSNAGFLRLTHHDGADPATMLGAPTPERDNPTTVAPMMPGVLSTPFETYPLHDFTDRDRLNGLNKACDAMKATFPHQVPVRVGNAARTDGQKLERFCPSDTSLKVADVTCATVDDVEQAVAKAKAAFPAWRDKPLAERAQLIEDLGVRMADHRDALSALMVFEVGKPYKSSDADLAEAVDFCHYYARRALSELAPQKQGHALGEDNQLFYEGRGPCVVIAPWNFPLAILAGMSAAALVAGNTVIMKPAEQSSAIANALHEHMLAVGIPPDVVQFLPGIGEDIGPALVNHKDVAQIAFTGSRAVGLSIVEAAAKTQAKQPEVKRVVCEMGGKNAIIVDDDADLDEAVLGVLDSAFGFAGQKCSACSRVLVHQSVADAFCERLVAAAGSLEIGPAHDPAFALGPVVDEEAHQRLMSVIDSAGEGAEKLFVGKTPKGGLFVPPAIFKVADPQHRLMQQELFGPVLAVHVVESFERALDVANGTEFSLTGAVYSRSPANLELARQRFKVGNLYLNQGSTGALVGRQPFGGFGMSGIGTKAGGPGYLALFANPRVITENTMRRGFTPDLDS